MSKKPAVRDQFSNKIEYYLTALSYAVGLGNVWRFPYLCYKNGGGSFLLPYFLSVIFLGLTFFFFESTIGQFTNLGPIKVWRLTPMFKGIGFAMFLMGTYVAIYYNMIIGWSMYYVYASFTALPSVPWASCNNPWNTEHCYIASPNTSVITEFNDTVSPSQEYFYNKVLGMTDGIEIMDSLRPHLVLCLALAWVLIFAGLCLGAKSLGKVSYFTAIFPYVMITALLIKGVQLPNSSEGIMHYVGADLSKLTSIDVWSDAATQIFFSLSICMGGVITLSSYNPLYNNTLKDSIIIVLANSLTSVYAGFAIFSVIGFMAQQTGKSIDEAADQGVGLAFVAYPAALARLPMSPFWSVVFFMMIITLGFGSQMTIVETIVSTLVDFWPSKLQKRKHLVLAFCCVMFFFAGLPMCSGAGVYILQLMDTYAVPYSAFFIALFEVIAIAWVYGIEKHMNNIQKMMGYMIYPKVYWVFMFKYGCPTIIIVMIAMVMLNISPLTYNEYIFPAYTEYIGWAMTLSSVIMIPLYAIYELLNVLTGRKTFKEILRPHVILKNQQALDGSIEKIPSENTSTSGESNKAFDSNESLSSQKGSDGSIQVAYKIAPAMMRPNLEANQTKPSYNKFGANFI